MLHYRILIVEDDESLAEMYRAKFEKSWYDAKVAVNGLDAIWYVTDFRPDVILLDIMMPSMDGLETLRVIRELAPSLKTKVIMFSNLNNKKDVEKCMQLGADGYFVKADTSPKEAVEKVAAILGAPHRLVPSASSQSKPDEEVVVTEVRSMGSLNYTCPCCGHAAIITLHSES